MNAATRLSLLCVLLVPTSGHSSSGHLERASISGTSYVRVEDWAHANNFQTRWAVPKQEFKLTGQSSLVFTVDSARMSFNGIHVWLSAPVALREGAAWIPAVDLSSTLQPLLFPAKNFRGRAIRSIVLDPGHGGKDPGNFVGRQQEKQYTLLLAKELADLLNKAGFKASLTRTSDSFLDLPGRPDVARRRGADLFISLHFNAFDSPSAQGIEVYCMTVPYTSSTNARGEGAGAGPYPGNRFDAKNVLLGYQLQKNLLRSLAVEDRGLRRARYAVLRSAEMPAVLIEGGFMTNPSEGRKIFDTKYRRQMAQAIVDGIKAYKELVEQ
jgi:N-acetylmuramoyl-L-alanine amidase